MPINYDEYPGNWKEISEYIRFERANNRCETCGAENGKPHPETGSKVVLTVAHIRHDKDDVRYNAEKYDPDDEENNLVAECQKCHNNRDKQYRKLNRTKTKLKGNIVQRVMHYGTFRDLNDCWTWDGYITKDGYGKVKIDGRIDYVHRFVVRWVLDREIEDGQHVDHLCRNRACFRPSHLEIVTPTENTRRGKRGKLTVPEVLKIHELAHKGFMYKKLAKIFNVDPSHISKICSGKRFKIDKKKIESHLWRDRKLHARNRKYGRKHNRKEQLRIFE